MCAVASEWIGLDSQENKCQFKLFSLFIFTSLTSSKFSLFIFTFYNIHNPYSSIGTMFREERKSTCVFLVEVPKERRRYLQVLISGCAEISTFSFLISVDNLRGTQFLLLETYIATATYSSIKKGNLLKITLGINFDKIPCIIYFLFSTDLCSNLDCQVQ